MVPKSRFCMRTRVGLITDCSMAQQWVYVSQLASMARWSSRGTYSVCQWTKNTWTASDSMRATLVQLKERSSNLIGHFGRSLVTLITAPAFYKMELVINADNHKDTFLNMENWTKGVVWVNGVNLGRYWAEEGPATTMYLPGKHVILALRRKFKPSYSSVPSSRNKRNNRLWRSEIRPI